MDALDTITQLWKSIMSRLRIYRALIKSLQTLLLLITGLSGFMSSLCPWLNFTEILKVAGSMFLAISGSTVLNMWYDRDIDARMKRTCWRPLPAGLIQPMEALILGLVLSTSGILWAFAIDQLYGVIILAGFFFDVLIYTVWLKRRSAWSIVFGGISGGMPILAGRVYGIGGIDWVGIVLSMAILVWIPTHIMTFNIRYFQDYQSVSLPTFPSRYGISQTQRIITISSLAAAILMCGAVTGIQIPAHCLSIVFVLSLGLFGLAVTNLLKPSTTVNYGLYKYGSIYMLCTMLVIAWGD